MSYDLNRSYLTLPGGLQNNSETDLHQPNHKENLHDPEDQDQEEPRSGGATSKGAADKDGAEKEDTPS